MKNENKNDKINISSNKIKVININNIDSKNKIFNQDLNCVDDNDKIVSRYFKTISYKTDENENNIDNNIINEKIKEQNKYNILNKTNNNHAKVSILIDKYIHIPLINFSIDNLNVINKKDFILNRKHIKKDKIYKLSNNFKFNSKSPKHFFKTFYEDINILNNIKSSRNKIYSLINKQKTSALKTYFQNLNLSNECYKNKSNKERKRRNLLNVENIYSQRKATNTCYRIKSHNYNDYLEKNQNINHKFELKKKYSVNEIKFPLNNDLIKKYRIINENNERFLEDIFKKQTLSNFNNKYTLKYKTSNSIKKENIKNLFSILKKYKYSDIDKKTAFYKYKSFKNNKKILEYN